MAAIDCSETSPLTVRRSVDAFAPEDWQRMVEATQTEDMRRVGGVEELLGSYAVYGIFSASKGLVGFARQAEREWTQVPDGRLIRAVEIGTVWTKPEYRGRGIGGALIKAAAADVHEENGLPLAICNEYSQKAFAAKGFKRAGNLAATPAGRQRIAMVNLAETDLSLEDAVAGIRRIPRFEELQLEAAEKAPGPIRRLYRRGRALLAKRSHKL